MIEDWIIQTLGSTIKYTNTPNEIHICCPVCGDKRYRLYINTINNVCYCHNCQFNGSTIKLIQRVEKTTYSKAVERLKDFQGIVSIPEKFKDIVEEKLLYPDIRDIPKRSIALPEDFKLLCQTDNITAGLAKEYLRSRSITSRQIQLHKFGLSPKLPNKIIIPIYEQDELRFWIARAIGNRKFGKESVPQTAPYQYSKSEVLFNLTNAIKKYKSVVLSEGVFDALSWGDIGVAMLGKTLYKEQLNVLLKYKSLITEGVYVGVDADATDSAIKICKTLKSFFPTFLVRIPEEFNDPNGYLQTHNQSAMWGLLSQALEFNESIEVKLRLGVV